MTESIKYMRVSGKYTKNGTTNGFTSILDPFGVRWSIMTRIEDLPEEESSWRVAEWAKSFSGE